MRPSKYPYSRRYTYSKKENSKKIEPAVASANPIRIDGSVIKTEDISIYDCQYNPDSSYTHQIDGLLINRK